MRVSLSRQGVKWSKYRCKCQATEPVFCICSCLTRSEGEEVVTWKSLEQRNLSGLFSPRSEQRLFVGLVYRGWHSE